MEPAERYAEIVDDLCARSPDVSTGQMMGMPCIKRSGKMVGGFWQPAAAMVFKLPAQATREEALALEGAELFDPSGMGRPMKEWVQVPAAHADRWPGLAEQALGPS